MSDSGWSTYIASVEDSAFIAAVMESQWFADDSGNLYIFDPWGDEWIASGCDPKVEDTLDAYIRENYSDAMDRYPEIPASVYEPLGLTLVEQGLKRYEKVTPSMDYMGNVRFYNA